MLPNTLYFGTIFLILALTIECRNCPENTSKVASSERALKKHPGCIIWWFLPGCVLGDRIAVDPFGIYPWKKFCRKYSDLQKHEICEGKVPANRINDELEEDLEKEEDDDDFEEEKQLSLNSDEITDVRSNIDQNDDKLISYIEKLEELEEQNETNDIFDVKKEPENIQQRPKRNVPSRKVIRKMKDSFIKSDVSPSRLRSLFRSKCGNPRPQLVKMCNMARKYIDAMGNSFVRGKRSPSIEENKPVQRLINQWADARFYKNDKEQHPGCGQFWFLPGCPLGIILGVDPFGQYPWERLCDYPSLLNEPVCIHYRQTSSQKYLGSDSGMPGTLLKTDLGEYNTNFNSWPYSTLESTEELPSFNQGIKLK